MQTLNKALLEEAKAFDGTWEWKGDDHNPAVIKMYAESGHSEIKRDEVPWCAAFVGFILAKVGLQNTGSLLAKSYLNWGEKVSLKEAQPGDIIIFHRGSESWQGHVGFLVSKGQRSVNVLGGNQGNQVNVSTYSLDRLAGIRRATPPRDNKAKSKTLQAASAGAVSAGTAGATAVSQLDGTAQIVTIAAITVVLVALLVIFRERLKKWAAGDR